MLIKKVRFLYAAFNVCIGLLLWIPIFYTYQTSHGINDAEYFQIQSIYYFLFCLIELPTGYISDRFGHKNAMIASGLFMTASNIMTIFWWGFWGFLFHFVLIALGRALMSGAASAYLYEFLEREERLDKYKEIEGQTRMWMLVSRIIVLSFVGQLYLWNATLPYWLTAMFCTLAALAAFLLPYEKIIHKKEKKSSFSILTLLLEQKTLLWVIGIGTGAFVLSRLTVVNLFQPILTQKEFAVVSFGYMFSAMNVAEAAGVYISSRSGKRISDLSLLVSATVVACLSLTFLSVSNQWQTAVVFLIFSFAFGLTYPALKQLLNQAITEKSLRATFLSFESIFDRSLCGLFALASGYYVSQGEMWSFLTVTAIGFSVVVLAMGYLLSKKLNST